MVFSVNPGFPPVGQGERYGVSTKNRSDPSYNRIACCLVFLPCFDLGVGLMEWSRWRSVETELLVPPDPYTVLAAFFFENSRKCICEISRVVKYHEADFLPSALRPIEKHHEG